MSDHSGMKLGKLAPSKDPRTLKLASFIDFAQLPTPPESTTRAQPFATKFPMFLNDQLGDCTCAAVAHMQQFWGDLSGKSEPFNDGNVLSLYEAVGGYRPGDPSTDGGAVEVDVLNYWRKTGIKAGRGHRKIYAYASIYPQHNQMVRLAAWLFEGLYIGIALPVTAQRQDVWDIVPNSGADGAPGSWGGHAVSVVDYDRDTLTVVTWGELKKMTWSFWNAYVDEAYAVMSNDELSLKGVSVEGFNRTALQTELAHVTA